jgi:tRNA-modifying protein YgfZ
MNQASTLQGAVRLTDWGVILASGEEAAAFLHGQLSNDIKGLDARHARLAAYCTAKGRMLASFVACQLGADLALACHASVLPATLKRLRMFVLRSKLRLDDATATVALLGLAGAAAQAHLGSAAPSEIWGATALGGASVVRLPDAEGQPRWLWAGASAQADAVLAALPDLPLATWNWLEVRSGVVPIVAETVEQFVPQMINYEVVGGVNFKKGCYPGQEIVARSQYLGKLKRRGVLVHAEAELRAGQEVYWSEDGAQPSGLVAVAAAAPAGGWDALLELKTAVLESGSLHAGSASGPSLSPQALPYALPADAPA